jgi:hypothetical protein
MTSELRIADARIEDDGNRLLRLTIAVENPSTRTLHLYRTLRAVRYDPMTKRLEVQLSDRGLEEPYWLGTFVFPRFTSVDPGGRTTFTVSVPRVITRIKPGQANVLTPEIEALPAHEAEIVDIELAWSGTPFYRDPRPNRGPRAMLVAWAQGHATFRLDRSTGQGGPGGTAHPNGEPPLTTEGPAGGDGAEPRRRAKRRPRA